MPKHQLLGQVISARMKKTVVVQTEQLKTHPLYKKQFKFHKSYKAHDEKSEYKVGDKVIIQECRPLSKDKKWQVVAKV